METKTKYTKLIAIFSFSLFLLCSLPTYAQQDVYDKSKFKQWNSMENGDWDFAPDWYYYSLHKNYSGAHWKWEWHGFKSGPRIYFYEDRSNQKRVFIERLAHILTVEETKRKTQAELDTITPIFIEETERSVERNVDLMYSQYKHDFEKLQNFISQSLTFCLLKSNGKLIEVISLIQRSNDFILNDIDYVHKTGVGYEMENTKRQIAYEEALKKMKRVAKTSQNLVMYANCFYKQNPGVTAGDLLNVIF